MNTRQTLETAARHLERLEGHVFDVLNISKPVSVEAAVNLAKVVSKLSPMVGNMIEFNGKPQIIGVCVASGKSVAEARDTHYHNPPDYLVIEPEDTRQRTRNLQQTNTNGYKFQGTAQQLRQAEKIVKNWGKGGKTYKPSPEYQNLLRQLLAKFPYRLDTNYAKMDRIAHPGIESFKTRIGQRKFHGIPVTRWTRILASEDDAAIREAVELLDITDSGASELVR